LLYDKICREDILVHAYRLARVNAGAPGVDGMTFARIKEQGLEAWLAGLRAELVSKTYRPDPVRRVMIPKANGGERPLGIPTIRDRVIQTAAKIVIEPSSRLTSRTMPTATGPLVGRWTRSRKCTGIYAGAMPT
jgi:RNA-directed DNA polymerase